ncbi:unnamed protein product [Caenorhabditis bovis]|uniref:Beta-1,4-N-acetylgalactosaminyltransferase n=1 Tax=Caenorhabditis bovis TaxID=2654633 RepID=A0A8S1F2B4_9PELO|nr:unnamed protein product [Caenorhabditis bovis]
MALISPRQLSIVKNYVIQTPLLRFHPWHTLRMAIRSIATSRVKLLVLVCTLLFTVHVLIYEIPVLYYASDMSSTTIIENVNALDAVLSNTATSESWFTSDLMNSTFSPSPFGGNTSSFIQDLQLLVADEQSKPHCNKTPPGLVGPIRVFEDEPTDGEMEKMFAHLHMGGHGKPQECTSWHRVAIVIPFRDRISHLRILLHNLHSLLTKQQLDYAIFVIEQVANQTFNRGKLMNVGYEVASQLYPWQCFIFHDVDLLPEDDRNLYACPIMPRHMSVAIDKFSYKLPYSTIFGGISALTREHFVKINGFSNDFWGWGGEDDDLATRTHEAGLSVSRYPAQIARYKMIRHKQESTNPVNKCRYKLMGRTRYRWQRDGVNSLKYKLLNLEFKKLYTHVYVDLLEKSSRKQLRREFPTCYG